MEVTINATKATNPIEKASYTKLLQELHDNVDKDNLGFLVEISRMPGINDKFRNNKKKIKIGLAL